jgi:hypothetical protein
MASSYQRVSCPACGASRLLKALNLDSEGKRVADPVVYGTVVKVCTAPGGYGTLRWDSYPMPEHVLRGVRAQLLQALAYVDSQLQEM